MFKILIAEDDPNLRKLISKHLQLNHYEVRECIDGKQAVNAFESAHFDLLITDIMMPNMDGDELVKYIKTKKKDFPVIMLTALDTIADKKKSFVGGADDYMTKPVDFEELILRIDALLRRYQSVSQKNFSHKSLMLDFDKKSLIKNGKEIELTKKEFLLLYKLTVSQGKIFSRSQLLDEIWGIDSYSIERTVDVHINKLREKIDSTEIELISVRGLGYKAVLK